MNFLKRLLGGGKAKGLPLPDAVVGEVGNRSSNANADMRTTDTTGCAVDHAPAAVQPALYTPQESAAPSVQAENEAGRRRDVMVLVEAFRYTNEYILRGQLVGIYDDPMMYSSRALNGLCLAAEKLLPREEVKQLFLNSPMTPTAMSAQQKRVVMLLAIELSIGLVGECPEVVPLMTLKTKLEGEAHEKQTVSISDASPLPIERGSAVTHSQTTPTSKSVYWKCPKCGGMLRKGPWAMLGNVVGVATCSNCGANLDQSDVYAGKYDVEEKVVNTIYKCRIIGSTVMWGDNHQVTFNNEYSQIELSWILDGNLFPVSSALTEGECRTLVEGNYSAAYQVALQSRQQQNLSNPEKSDAYDLAITKLHLSYAVRNNVAFPEAVRIFRVAMGFKER